MFKRLVIMVAFIATFSVYANEGAEPKGIAPLNHVFVIMLENHGYPNIIGNPKAPFINQYANAANQATNYFAVGHPSLINYLEIVGGSNFGVQSDDPPDWHQTKCNNKKAICPLVGTLSDAETPAVNFDGKRSIPVSHSITGKSIADQLMAKGLSWRSYQESLPLTGADRVEFSDGFFTNNKDLTPLYAVKHNPFMYFQSVQDHQLKNVFSFDGAQGLYTDLKLGNMPSFSLIVPNQCNDQHGTKRAEGCQYDSPYLIPRSDFTVQKIVTAIHESPIWKSGRNAIILVWDENDFTASNRVLLVVDKNYGIHKLKSEKLYSHFSLLKSIESGFGLPCLNHACDSETALMTDLFS